jgi:hypothetical protein
MSRIWIEDLVCITAREGVQVTNVPVNDFYFCEIYEVQAG